MSNHSLIIGRGLIGNALANECIQRKMPFSIFGRNIENFDTHDQARNIFLNFNEDEIETRKYFKELFDKLKVKSTDKVIYTSSGGAVYGDLVSFPTKEDAVTSPVTKYGQKKLLGEVVIQELSDYHKNNLIILRPGNVYDGQGKSKDLLSTLVNCFRLGKEFQLINKGEAIRDFVHKTDFAFAALELNKSAASGVFNIGTGLGTRISELVALFSKVTSERISIVEPQTTTPEVKKSVLSTEKLGSRINWSPTLLSEQFLMDIISQEDQ